MSNFIPLVNRERERELEEGVVISMFLILFPPWWDNDADWMPPKGTPLSQLVSIAASVWMFHCGKDRVVFFLVISSSFWSQLQRCWCCQEAAETTEGLAHIVNSPTLIETTRNQREMWKRLLFHMMTTRNAEKEEELKNKIKKIIKAISGSRLLHLARARSAQQLSSN